MRNFGPFCSRGSCFSCFLTTQPQAFHTVIDRIVGSPSAFWVPLRPTIDALPFCVSITFLLFLSFSLNSSVHRRIDALIKLMDEDSAGQKQATPGL